VRKFDEARQAFVARMETNDTYLSARRGILPPWINTKTWFDTDNAWADAMSVYVPSLTNAAATTGREMRESDIIKSIDDNGRPSIAPGTGFTDEKAPPTVKRPGKEVKPGPSGKIEPK
jgi:hypothetical protein